MVEIIAEVVAEGIAPLLLNDTVGKVPVFGLKLALKVTPLAKPLEGIVLRLKDVVAPWVIVEVAGEQFAEKSGAGNTFTVTLEVAVPPGPLHVSTYVVVAVKLPLDRLPDVPVQPEGEIEHDVALLEVQAIVAAVL